jgi:hypothetical protein
LGGGIFLAESGGILMSVEEKIGREVIPPKYYGLFFGKNRRFTSRIVALSD